MNLLFKEKQNKATHQQHPQILPEKKHRPGGNQFHPPEPSPVCKDPPDSHAGTTSAVSAIHLAYLPLDYRECQAHLNTGSGFDTLSPAHPEEYSRSPFTLTKQEGSCTQCMRVGGMGQLLGLTLTGGEPWPKNISVQWVVRNEDLEIAHPKSRMLHRHVHPENMHLTLDRGSYVFLAPMFSSSSPQPEHTGQDIH